MNIVFIHNTPLNLLIKDGDLQNSILSVSSLCQAFAELNHTVTLALPVVYKDRDDIISWLHSSSFDEIKFNIYPLKANPRKRRIWKYLLPREIYKMVRITEPDIVITRSVIWALSLMKLRINVVIDMHCHRIAKFKFIDNFVYKKLIKSIGPDKKMHIVTISQKLAEYIIEIGIPSNFITVAHNGFDTNHIVQFSSKKKLRVSLGLPEDAIIVLYAGSFWPGRGIELFLNVAKMLAGTTCLMIGGPERFRTNLLNEAEKNNMKNIRIISSVTRRQLPEYLFAADVLVGVFSSKLLTSNYFSSLKIVEYLATGVPVVTQNHASILELITDGVTGYIAERDSAKSLRRKIIEAINDPNSIQVGLNARGMAFNQLTWQHRAKKFLNIINK